MGLDFTPLVYLAFAGMGALLGLVIAAFLAAIAMFVPAVWPWVVAPVIVGVIGGFLAAAFVD